jgi:peptidyl-prolyl cis-trans isomerase D
MATITKIRQKSGLVLIVIGLGMGAFLLGDFFRGSGPGRQSQEIGSINGKTIDRMDFENSVNDEVEALRNINQSPTPQQIDQIRARVWNNMIQEETVGNGAKEAGFAVTKGEYDDIRWGDNINPAFLNDATFSPEGKFDPNQVKNYFNVINTNYPLYAKVQQKQLIDNQMYSKYYFAVSKGLKANDIEALAIAESNDSKISFNFVLNRYSSIPDSTVVVSDSDVKAYYNEHKNDKQFKQLASRGIKYVSFPVLASESDISLLKNQMELMVPEFKNTDNDSLFVINNSDNRRAYKQVYKDGTYLGEQDSLILNAEIGDVVGPFVNGANYAIVKVSGDYFEKEARVRHILLRTNGINDEEIEARADSLIRVIKRKRNFEAMVDEFSDDVASVKDGGVYDWFPEGRMVAEFNDFSFNGRIGEIKSVKTTYGFHIVEILGQREHRQPEIAIVSRLIGPSSETFDNVYNEATDFSINNNNSDIESFELSAQENGYTIAEASRILTSSKGVPGMASAEALVRWVNTAGIDDISSPIELTDKFVVAYLINVTEKGMPNYENVKDRFRNLVIKEKKVEMAKAEMAGISDLDELASALNEQVRNASNIPLSSNTIPGGGSDEPEVIGKAFTLEVGDLSIPIEGKDGVYVIELTDKNSIDVAELDSELFAEEADGKYESVVNTGVFSALRNDADIEDNRASFY